MKGKQANGVRSQYNSTLPRNVVCPALLPLLLLLIRTPRLPVVDRTDAPTDLNGLVRFGERRILVSARVPSRSARAIHTAVQERREIAMDLCMCCVDYPSIYKRINRKTRFNFLLPRTILTASMHEDVLVLCVCLRARAPMRSHSLSAHAHYVGMSAVCMRSSVTVCSNTR